MPRGGTAAAKRAAAANRPHGTAGKSKAPLGIADEKGDALTIAKLNVDEAQEIARRFEVMSIPTMILFKDGAEAKRIIGAKPKQALRDDLAEYL